MSMENVRLSDKLLVPRPSRCLKPLNEIPMITHTNLHIALAICCTLAASNTTLRAQATDVLSEIERMASPKEKSDPTPSEALVESIEKNPAEVSSSLLSKLKNKKLKEKQITVYVWALGLTKDPSATDTITRLYQQSKSDTIKANCLRALAMIGGKQSGEFLLSTLAATSDKEMRFNILNLLGQMQYEPALPKTEEVLKQDPKDLYWQSIFVFGKMGDLAVPFLMKRISDKDLHIRVNVISVLGNWLIPPEAAKPLQDQFWTEKEAMLRGLILGSLERTMADLSQMKTFFEQVVAKEKDEEVQKFARQTLNNMDHIKTTIVSFSKNKTHSESAFQREYSQLLKSEGKKGDYEALGISSTLEDEPKLKTLRERILQRDSDEAFYDYQKVNEIIMRNRMQKVMENDK